MKKEYIWMILLFGGIWGLSEVILGGLFYANNLKFASIPLTIIAIGILSYSRKYISIPGSATLIGALAMLFKFLNEPQFKCHVLAILFLGVCFDACFSLMKRQNSSIKAAIATYGGYLFFALVNTYIAQNPFWIKGGLSKIASYVLISGTITAIGAAIISPIAINLAEQVKNKEFKKIALLPRAACCLMWLFSLGIFLNTLIK